MLKCYSYYLFRNHRPCITHNRYNISKQLSGSDNSEILDFLAAIPEFCPWRLPEIPGNNVFTFCCTMCNLCTKFWSYWLTVSAHALFFAVRCCTRAFLSSILQHFNCAIKVQNDIFEKNKLSQLKECPSEVSSQKSRALCLILSSHTMPTKNCTFVICCEYRKKNI